MLSWEAAYSQHGMLDGWTHCLSWAVTESCYQKLLPDLPLLVPPLLQVPDVFQIIVKEKGVFTNVTSPSTKAKLRLLFEVAPLAFLVSGD